MFSAGGIREVDYDRLDVWANKGLTASFEKIPGVFKATTQGIENSYMIFVDPRYNLKWVMAEVEAVAKTEQPKEENKDKWKGAIFTFDFSSFLIDGDEAEKPKPARRKAAKKTTRKK